MKKYKAGDLFTFSDVRPYHWNKQGLMDHFLGKTVQLTSVSNPDRNGVQRIVFSGAGCYVFLSTDSPTKFNVGDILTISGFGTGGLVHYFPLGIDVEVIRVIKSGGGNIYDVCSKPSGDCYLVSEGDLILKETKVKNTFMKQMKDAVLDTAKKLLKANNTVTTLEIKVDLRKNHSHFYWTQDTVSKYMDELANEGNFTYSDNGTFRVYSYTKSVSTGVAGTTHVSGTIGTTTPVAVAKTTTKTKQNMATTATISRTKALDLMKNNKGHFFTATFMKKDGSTRTINGQYLKDQGSSNLGYVKVKESGKLKTDPNDSTRQINLQTLQVLKIAGKTYKVR